MVHRQICRQIHRPSYTSYDNTGHHRFSIYQRRQKAVEVFRFVFIADIAFLFADNIHVIVSCEQHLFDLSGHL